MANIFKPDWERLPEELWMNHVLKNLPTGTLSRVALVLKQLNKVATDPLLWASRQIRFDKAKVISEKPFMGFLRISRFTKIKSLDLSGQMLSCDFAEALFKYIDSSECQLAALNISIVNLKKCGLNCNSVDRGEGRRCGKLNEKLVGKAIGKLEEAKLVYFMVETMRSTKSFVAEILQNGTSSLRSINLSGLDFGEVSPKLFAEAIGSLQRVKLQDCENLSPAMITALISFIAKQESTSLTLLSVTGNNIYPENSPDELALGISKLKHLHLDGDRGLTREQVRAVLEVVPTSNLQSLDIGMNHYKEVPIDIIRKAILHLNHGRNVVVPVECKTVDEEYEIWNLLVGENIFSF